MDMELNGIKVSSNLLDMYRDGRYDTIHHIILDLDNKKFLGYVGTREDSLKAVEGTNLKVIQAQWDGDDGAWDGIVNGPDLGNDEPHWAYQKWEKDIDSNYDEINDLIDEWLDYEDAEEACTTNVKSSRFCKFTIYYEDDNGLISDQDVTYDESLDKAKNLDSLKPIILEDFERLSNGLKGGLYAFVYLQEFDEVDDDYESEELVAEYSYIDGQLKGGNYVDSAEEACATKSVKTKNKHSSATESFDSVERELFEAMKKGRTNIL
jgi:hypothetical protein